MAQGLINRRIKGPQIRAGEKEFLTSGTLIVPNYCIRIEYFLVGGGGGGGYSVIEHKNYDYSEYGSKTGSYGITVVGGGGAAGGYIIHGFLEVNPKEELIITIGAGGKPGAFSPMAYDPSSEEQEEWIGQQGTDGTATTVYRGETQLLSAAGGQKGEPGRRTDYAGSQGACGGGYGGYYQQWYDAEEHVTTHTIALTSDGGSVGGNGHSTTAARERYNGSVITETLNSHLGQGQNCKLWLDDDETEIFAGGGGGRKTGKSALNYSDTTEGEGGNGGGGDGEDSTAASGENGKGGGAAGGKMLPIGCSENEVLAYINGNQAVGGTGYAIFRWSKEINEMVQSA